jgi:hypothetical protein
MVACAGGKSVSEAGQQGALCLPGMVAGGDDDDHNAAVVPALLYACASGSLAVVKQWATGAAEVMQLHKVVANGVNQRPLFSAGTDDSNSNSGDDTVPAELPCTFSALSVAARHGQLGVVEHLLSLAGVSADGDGSVVNLGPHMRCTPLGVAAAAGHLSVVRAMLDSSNSGRVGQSTKDVSVDLVGLNALSAESGTVLSAFSMAVLGVCRRPAKCDRFSGAVRGWFDPLEGAGRACPLAHTASLKTDLAGSASLEELKWCGELECLEDAALLLMSAEGDSFELGHHSLLCLALLGGMYRVSKAIICHSRGVSKVAPTLRASLYSDPKRGSGEGPAADDRACLDALLCMVPTMAARHNDPQLLHSFVSALELDRQYEQQALFCSRLLKSPPQHVARASNWHPCKGGAGPSAVFYGAHEVAVAMVSYSRYLETALSEDDGNSGSSDSTGAVKRLTLHGLPGLSFDRQLATSAGPDKTSPLNEACLVQVTADQIRDPFAAQGVVGGYVLVETDIDAHKQVAVEGEAGAAEARTSPTHHATHSVSRFGVVQPSDALVAVQGMSRLFRHGRVSMVSTGSLNKCLPSIGDAAFADRWEVDTEEGASQGKLRRVSGWRALDYDLQEGGADRVSSVHKSKWEEVREGRCSLGEMRSAVDAELGQARSRRCALKVDGLGSAVDVSQVRVFKALSSGSYRVSGWTAAHGRLLALSEVIASAGRRGWHVMHECAYRGDKVLWSLLLSFGGRVSVTDGRGDLG